jgi:uncharacterized protein YbaR (Trm112 family)
MSEPDDQRTHEARVDPKILELLICPVSKGPLVYDEAAQELISRAACLAYPIRNGVALMTEETARPLDAESSSGTAAPSQ